MAQTLQRSLEGTAEGVEWKTACLGGEGTCRVGEEDAGARVIVGKVCWGGEGVERLERLEEWGGEGLKTPMTA